MSEILLKSPGRETPVVVEVQRCREGECGDYRVQLDQDAHDVEVICVDDGSAVLRIHGRIVPVCVLRDGHRMNVWVRGRTYVLERVERVARRASGGAATTAQQTALSAPMPGTILKIHVSAGDSFAAHQPLIVMESMKMEMTLSAPHDGRIREVLCQPGQLVEMGALLVRFEDGPGDEISR